MLVRLFARRQLKFVDERVSVIVGFTDYEFYDLRNTIDSCLRLNAEDDGLVGELIVIDDGSTLDYVIDDARKYFRSIAKATLIRHDPSSTQQGNNNGERLGTANARLAGAMRAKGTVLVFLSPTVICSRGWLEPLVEAVDQHPDSIVAPHFDRIRDPISLEYQLTSDWVVGRASWDLAIRMREVPPASATGGDPKEDETNAKQPKAPQYIRTSAARGDAFAVQRQFYFDVGGYDPHLAIDAVNGGAGEQIELSIRTWMCGGVIITATCSRVGVLNLHDPVKVSRMRRYNCFGVLEVRPATMSAEYASRSSPMETAECSRQRRRASTHDRSTCCQVQ
jgi:polypeptide N-acetylgalactosaminyltransferase